MNSISITFGASWILLIYVCVSFARPLTTGISDPKVSLSDKEKSQMSLRSNRIAKFFWPKNLQGGLLKIGRLFVDSTEDVTTLNKDSEVIIPNKMRIGVIRFELIKNEDYTIMCANINSTYNYNQDIMTLQNNPTSCRSLEDRARLVQNCEGNDAYIFEPSDKSETVVVENIRKNSSCENLPTQKLVNNSSNALLLACKGGLSGQHIKPDFALLFLQNDYTLNSHKLVAWC